MRHEDEDGTPHQIAGERLVTIIGLVLSIGVAVAVPALAGQRGAQISVILGLLAFTTGYLLTMDLANRVRVRAMESRLLRRFEEAERSRFGALPLQRLLTVPDIEASVRDVVSAAADARAKRMQFLANRTIEQIQLSREEVLRISQGTFVCADRREELRLLRYALMDSRVSVKAVAALGLEHWRTHDFGEYFDVYLEFAAELEQTRIFLVEPDEVRDPVMVEILEHHAAAGVETYALDKTSLPPELCRPLVLFDDSLLLQHSKMVDANVQVQFTDDFVQLRDARESLAALSRRKGTGRGSLQLWPARAADVAPTGTLGSASASTE